MTGRCPSMPVPTTRRLHSQGISSFSDTGVWPNSSRNSRDGFFLRLRNLPRSRMTSLVYLRPSISTEPTALHLPHFIDISLVPPPECEESVSLVREERNTSEPPREADDRFVRLSTIGV